MHAGSHPNIIHSKSLSLATPHDHFPSPPEMEKITQFVDLCTATTATIAPPAAIRGLAYFFVKWFSDEVLQNTYVSPPLFPQQRTSISLVLEELLEFCAAEYIGKDDLDGTQRSIRSLLSLTHRNPTSTVASVPRLVTSLPTIGNNCGQHVAKFAQVHGSHASAPPKISNSGLSPLAQPELYQPAYGNVLATIVAPHRQAGYEPSPCPRWPVRTTQFGVVHYSPGSITKLDEALFGTQNIKSTSTVGLLTKHETAPFDKTDQDLTPPHYAPFRAITPRSIKRSGPTESGVAPSIARMDLQKAQVRAELKREEERDAASARYLCTAPVLPRSSRGDFRLRTLIVSESMSPSPLHPGIERPYTAINRALVCSSWHPRIVKPPAFSKSMSLDALEYQFS
ncbi:hypothetical protein B0H14DRAFT_2581757 [Mycena olivaceomarginata]|nr:hypothetical protein B0H14DRAFT_2581757 [Mycena olivaceomarginata]